MTAVIIGGHQRSGTTILAQVLARHPQVGLTVEFANFQGLNRSLRENLRFILKRWRTVRLRNDFLQPPYLKRANFILNSLFIPIYMAGLLAAYGHLVRLPDIEAALRRLFPRKCIVGDKFPDYVFTLGRLAKADDLRRIIIYRDCRDVTSSALVQARTNWRGQHFVSNFDSAEKVAARWVRAIEIMEHHRSHIHIVRYEDLVHEPRRELAALAAVLDIDPGGFRVNWLREDRVGKHRRGLTPAELEAVKRVAGPTMERLGYAL